MASNLSKRIRATIEHEDDERYDLAGFTEAQAHDLIAAAFSEPHPGAKPLRFTFIIGGGKLVRSKYDEQLGKWLTAELRRLGFEDDKGASLGSTGAYKMQHDTGQNLIYLHIFPRVTGGGAAAGGADAGGGDGAAAAAAAALPPFLARAVEAGELEFPRLVASKVAPWAQKRRLHGLLAGVGARLGEIEGKLASRVPLGPEDQALYDAPGASAAAVLDKATWLQARMKEQASAGALTAQERAVVLGEIDAKLAAAPTGGEGAKAAAQREALVARRAALAAAFSAAPAALYPVAGLADIRRARAELARLDRIEAAGAVGPGGRLLTPAEALARTRELDTRVDVTARLSALCDAARGWFESSDELEARIREQSAGAAGGGAAAKGGMGGARR